MSRLRRPLTLLAVLLASGGLAACGKHHDEDAPVVEAELEGLYRTIDHLKYQVQISRQLNPHDAQDNYYLRDLPARDQALKPGEVWFGVFLRVQNETDEARLPATDIEIEDTLDETFHPLTPAPTNVFIYRSVVPIPPGKILPFDDTPGYTTPIQGALVLFKLPTTALDNRPLELKIVGRGAPRQTGIFTLDV